MRVMRELLELLSNRTYGSASERGKKIKRLDGVGCYRQGSQSGFADGSAAYHGPDCVALVPWLQQHFSLLKPPERAELIKRRTWPRKVGKLLRPKVG